MSRAIVGNVSWEGGVADLHQDGSWSVPAHPWMEGILKLLYSDTYRGPSDGPFGVAILNRVARDLDGTATIVNLDTEDHPERVY